MNNEPEYVTIEEGSYHVDEGGYVKSYPLPEPNNMSLSNHSPIFTGADYQVFFHPLNGTTIKVGNLESIVWTRNINGIVGSMILAQYDRDPLIANGVEPFKPFNFTIVAVNKEGNCSSCSLMNVVVNSVTMGFSSNDLANSVICEFIASEYVPWAPLDIDAYLDMEKS